MLRITRLYYFSQNIVLSPLHVNITGTVFSWRRTWYVYVQFNQTLLIYYGAGYNLLIYEHLADLITTKLKRRQLWWKKMRHDLRCETKVLNLVKALKHKELWHAKQLQRLFRILQIIKIQPSCWIYRCAGFSMLPYILKYQKNPCCYCYQPRVVFFNKKRAGITKTRLKRFQILLRTVVNSSIMSLTLALCERV